MRLDKFLADVGLATRSEVKQLLKQKRVAVNGQIVTSAKLQVNEYQDEILVDGNPIAYQKFLYYVMNKPKGVISATEDKRHRTVLDLLDPLAIQKEVFPVGRLDIDTHGLLFLTNNGSLAHAMLSPKKHVAKIYHATIEGIITEQDQQAFQAGIQLEDGYRCLPANLTILAIDEQANCSKVAITIHEGKFHQIKRMIVACGKRVVDLQRIQMGPLMLDDKLALGASRCLTEDELASLSQFNVELF